MKTSIHDYYLRWRNRPGGKHARLNAEADANWAMCQAIIHGDTINGDDTRPFPAIVFRDTNQEWHAP